MATVQIQGRPFTWVSAALSLAFALLMLYIPYQFQAPPYRYIYPYLHLFGALYLSAAFLMAIRMSGWTYRHHLDMVGKALFLLTVAAQALLVAIPAGLVTRQFTLLVLIGATLAALFWAQQEERVVQAFYTVHTIGLGLLIPGWVVPTAYDHPVTLGISFLAAGAVRVAYHLWPGPSLKQAALLVTIPPSLWFAGHWFDLGNWTGTGIYLVLALVTAVLGLELHVRWAERVSGLRRRILALALAVSVIPLLVLGSLAVMAVERLDRAEAFAQLSTHVEFAESEVAEYMAANAGRMPDAQFLAGLDQRLPKATIQVIALGTVPESWPAAPSSQFIDMDAEGGWQLVAFSKRPDLGLAVIARLPANRAFSHAQNVAVGILLAAVISATAAAALGALFSERLTQRLAEVRSVATAISRKRFDVRAPVEQADKDEVMVLGETINQMAQALEAYTEELQAQSEELQSQAEELQAQSEELHAQNEELLTQAEEIHAQAARLEQARIELDETIALLNTLLESAPVGFAFMDRDLRYVRVNQALADMHGIPIDRHLGRAHASVLPKLAETTDPVYRNVMVTGIPLVNWEVAGETPASPGQTRYWLVSLYPVRIGDGQIIGLGEVVTEISERKRLENALRASNEHLNSVIKASPLPIQMLHPDGTVRGWNEAAERLYGWTEPEVLGGPLPTVPPEEAEAFAHLLGRVREGEMAVGRVVRRQRRDGTRLDVSLSVAPLLDGDGNLSGIVTVSQDITERTRFLQVAAHELRNPMAGIAGILALLRRRVQSGRPLGDYAHTFGVVEREVQRLSQLLNDILRAFQVQEGYLSLKQEPVNLSDLIAFTLEPLLLTGTTHQFRLEGIDREPVWVLGDPGRLEEVVRNILSNAIKYSPGKSMIRVRCTLEGDRVLLDVTDSGVGIPAHQVDRIFEPFFRADNLSEVDPGGMGLGLFICRDLIQRHGGEIWVKSQQGQGTTFTIALPVLKEEVS